MFYIFLNLSLSPLLVGFMHLKSVEVMISFKSRLWWMVHMQGTTMRWMEPMALRPQQSLGAAFTGV